MRNNIKCKIYFMDTVNINVFKRLVYMQLKLNRKRNIWTGKLDPFGKLIFYNNWQRQIVNF